MTEIGLIDCEIGLIDCEIGLIYCEIGLIDCGIGLIDCEIGLIDCEFVPSRTNQLIQCNAPVTTNPTEEPLSCTDKQRVLLEKFPPSLQAITRC